MLDERRALWTEPRDVWSLLLEPAWADFYGAKGVCRPVPLLDAVPITAWLHRDGAEKLHCILNVSHLVSVQINHYQYLFLLRLAEELSDLATYLSLDQRRILGPERVEASSIVAAALLPQFELTFVMPSACPGKESSGGDLESVLPDSSSLAEELAGGSGHTLWAAQSDLSLQTSPRPPGPATPLPNGLPTQDPPPPLSPPATCMQPQNNFNTGLSSVKKGFNSLLTSIDSWAQKGGSVAEDFSDTMSWRSDASSDSEQYVVVAAGTGEGADSMFKVLFAF